MDPTTQQDPIVLGLGQPDLQKGCGSSCPVRPNDLESRWGAGPNILGSGYAPIPKDIIICIINIINFISCIINFLYIIKSINVKNSIIGIINNIIINSIKIKK